MKMLRKEYLSRLYITRIGRIDCLGGVGRAICHQTIVNLGHTTHGGHDREQPRPRPGRFSEYRKIILPYTQDYAVSLKRLS